MTDIDYMIDSIAADLIVMLVNKRRVDIKTATEMVYSSCTFEKLTDPKTGLYFQSPLYVYSYLDNEINTGVLC